MLDKRPNDLQLITQTDALSVLCRQLRASPYVAADTEFMRETTYWPNLCLIQLAAPGIAAIVDPLSPGLDLAPFYDLMADRNVTKVFHAARQDIEIVHHATGIIPDPLFDTQVAAMVCGFGEAVSYSALVKQITGRNHDKTSRYTDWSHRPLSERQLTYALGDVTHLRDVYIELRRRLDEAGRAHWLSDEMALLTNPATYETAPEDAWKRLKLRVRTPQAQAIAMEVAAWRERQAQALNVPRSRIIKDEAILDLAAQAPRTLQDLAKLRSFNESVTKSQRGRDLIELVERALSRDLSALKPAMQPQCLPPSASAVAELLRVLLKAVAAKHGVAAKLIATSEELDKIALAGEADVPAMKGWRRELFGEAALALRNGRLAITMKGGEVHLQTLG
jgi:ribonuclease D